MSKLLQTAGRRYLFPVRLHYSGCGQIEGTGLPIAGERAVGSGRLKLNLILPHPAWIKMRIGIPAARWYLFLKQRSNLMHGTRRKSRLTKSLPTREGYNAYV
jgi:hypothetical protein